MTIPGSPKARELARLLIERETSGVAEAAEHAAAMQRVYTDVASNLRRSIGDDGYNALLARALASTETEQPVLKEISRVDTAGVHLSVAAGVERHGAAAVRSALESLLSALVDILSDLIGADMVRNLLVHADSPRSITDRGTT